MKKVLILNGSPKKKGSTSGLLGRMAGLLLAGWDVRYASLRAKRDYPKILEQFPEIDALILAVPLYVDGIPSHVLEFLQQAEEFCHKSGCRFLVYAVSNNGFIEGAHNKSHLRMYRCWCQRAGLTWGGGVGIGGGEMFHCLAVYYPIAFAVLIARNLIRYWTGTAVTPSGWLPLAENIGIYLFFNCGIFYSSSTAAYFTAWRGCPQACESSGRRKTATPVSWSPLFCSSPWRIFSWPLPPCSRAGSFLRC